MNITWNDTFKLTSGLAVRDFINKSYVSAEARLQHADAIKKLDYDKERDYSLQKYREESANREYQSKREDRILKEEIAQQDRIERSEQAFLNRMHDKEMQRAEHKMRQAEIDVQFAEIESRNQIAELNAQVIQRNADLDREAQLSMHAIELDNRLSLQARELNHREQLELRKLRVQENLAKQNERLQVFLAEQGIKSTKELEQFKVLAMRETQILLAREKTQDMLQDTLVQDALKTFPLNISPLVLLKNRPHSLSNLLRFSAKFKEPSLIPDVAHLYEDVLEYSQNPEALNVFIAPIYISSTVKNREHLTQQIWDLIYQKVEKFFTIFYNRREEHPVILYPTAWKDSTSSGQHASETLHFFLKEMPCIVLEPRFDGHSFELIMSGWNNGYLSTDQIRTQTTFNVNITTSVLKNLYSRSQKVLNLLKKLGNGLTQELKEKKIQVEQNISYFEGLNISEKILNNDLEDIESLGIYDLFTIDPSQDLKNVADIIASLICINLAVIADIHHLQSTDTLPIFPKIFKLNFPELYENKELRETIAECYIKALKFLRVQDASSVDLEHRRELERVRELQIENINRDLELIDEQEMFFSIESQVKEYIKEKIGIEDFTNLDLWVYATEQMTADDIPFFKEILPNIKDKRILKRIDKKIAELQR